jgi:hypothetical protein
MAKSNWMKVAMRFLKIVVAIVLLLLAAVAAIAEASFINRSIESNWHQHCAAILFASLCVCAVYLLLRQRVDPVSAIYCPRCHAMGGHEQASPYGPSAGPVATHVGGFVFSLLYSGSRPQRFRCRQCTEVFYSHTPISRGYRLLFLLLVALVVNHIWADLSEIWGS